MTKTRSISCTLRAMSMLFVPLQRGDVPSFPAATTQWSVFGTSSMGLADGYWWGIPRKVGTIPVTLTRDRSEQCYSLQRGSRLYPPPSMLRIDGRYRACLEPENWGMSIYLNRSYVTGRPPWLVALTSGLCGGRFYASHMGS